MLDKEIKDVVEFDTYSAAPSNKIILDKAAQMLDNVYTTYTEEQMEQNTVQVKAEEFCYICELLLAFAATYENFLAAEAPEFAVSCGIH